MLTIKPQIEKNGKLKSIVVTTKQLEFWYRAYDDENAVGIHIMRRLDDSHIRALDAYVPPDVGEKLVDAFMTGKSTGAEETWKHVFTIVEIVVNNFSYEGDYVEKQEDVKVLRHYIENVLDLIKICTKT